MSRILVDTNVLLSFVTDRDPEQQRQAASLFQASTRGLHQLRLHQVVLTELVYVLLNVYRTDPQQVARILGDLLALPGVAVVHGVTWSKVLDLWPGRIGDFGDALLAASALEDRPDSCATFDRRLRSRLEALGVPCLALEALA